MAKEKKIKLTDAAFYILAVLGEPLHGYAIMKKVEEVSGGEDESAFKLGPATLYTTLTKLVDQKMISQLDDLEQSDERRKPYLITDLGWKVLADETKRRAKMVNAGEIALNQMKKD